MVVRWNSFLSEKGGNRCIGPLLYMVDNLYEKLTYMTGHGWPYGKTEVRPLYEPLERIFEHAFTKKWEYLSHGFPSP